MIGADAEQDTRLLLVISNFGHLTRTMIPSMLSELETALGVSVQDDKQVSYFGLRDGKSTEPVTDAFGSRARTGQDVIRNLRQTEVRGIDKHRSKRHFGQLH